MTRNNLLFEFDPAVHKPILLTCPGCRRRVAWRWAMVFVAKSAPTPAPFFCPGCGARQGAGGPGEKSGGKANAGRTGSPRTVPGLPRGRREVSPGRSR